MDSDRFLRLVLGVFVVVGLVVIVAVFVALVIEFTK